MPSSTADGGPSHAEVHLTGPVGMAASRTPDRDLTASEFLSLLARRTLLVVIALAALGWVSHRWAPVSWLPPALLAVVALIMLSRALRIDVAGVSDRVILAYTFILIAIGLFFGAVYLWVTSAPWLLLAAVSLSFVALAGLGARLRLRWRMQRLVPPALAVVALALTVTGAVLADRTGTRLAIIVYVVSILVGYLAIMFGTEPWIQRPGSPFHSPVLARLAIFALVVAAVWLVVLGATFYSVVLIGAIAVLTLFITLDGDGEIMLVLLLAALVWAIIPRSVDRTPIEDHLGGDHDLVIALGDSYMSGEGAERYVDGTNVRVENLCRRAETAWSQRFVEQVADPGTQTVSLACSGAVARNLDGRAQYRGEPIEWPGEAGFVDGADQLSQLRWLVESIDVDRIDSVVVGIGGNDAGFTQVGIACVGPGNCDELAGVWLPRLGEVEDRLATVFTRIRTTLDEAGADAVPLVVAGYPVPLTPDGCAWTWLSESEHAFVTRFIGLLNGAVSAAAGRAGARYIDTIPQALERQELRFCEAGLWDGGVNFFELNPQNGSLLAALDPRNWVNNSFHPNEDGHAALTTAVVRWQSGESDSPPDPAAGVVPEPMCETRTECNDLVGSWSRRQIALFFRRISAPVILSFLGSWLLITRAQARFRARRVNLFDKLLRPLESRL